MHSRICLLPAVVFVTGVSLLSGASDRRFITQTHLFAFQWIANPQISPDGSKVIYTLVKTTAKHDDYETALWIIPSAGGTARQLTSGTRGSGPSWWHDGQ